MDDGERRALVWTPNELLAGRKHRLPTQPDALDFVTFKSTSLAQERSSLVTARSMDLAS